MKPVEEGDKLHTLATVQKVRKGIPTVLLIDGKRYTLDQHSIPYNNTKTYEKLNIPNG